MKDRKMLVSIRCLGMNPVIRFRQKPNASILPKNAIKFTSNIRQFIFNFSLKRIACVSISQVYTHTYLKGQETCDRKNTVMPKNQK